MAQGGGAGDAGRYSTPTKKFVNNPAIAAAKKASAMKKAVSLLGGAGGARTRKRGQLIGDAMIPSLLLGG